MKTTPAPIEAAPPESASTILVVDDDPGNRDALGRRLKRRGYGVRLADSGLEALRCVDAEEIDLILLDVMMPGMSGLEVLTRLRETRGPTMLPIIMATARDESGDVVEALRLGANDYVTKPLDFPVVIARVQTQLQLKQAVAQVLELERRLSQRNAELETANGDLRLAADRTRRELDAAARVQRAMLPTAPPSMEALRFAWSFDPCEQLAGDSLNVFSIDDQHVGFYVLDVSGHGVAASLLAVAATRLLMATRDADSLVSNNGIDAGPPVGPAEVAQRLNQRFPWNPATEQFLTLFYAVIHARSRELTYVSAGHPGAIRLVPGAAPQILSGTGLPIGIGQTYEQHNVRLNAGDRVYVYSDGLTEAIRRDGTLFGVERLAEALTRAGDLPLQESITKVLEEIRDWQQGEPAKDDISLLAVECQ